jgi:hypothetical protein
MTLVTVEVNAVVVIDRFASLHVTDLARALLLTGAASVGLS